MHQVLHIGLTLSVMHGKLVSSRQCGFKSNTGSYGSGEEQTFNRYSKLGLDCWCWLVIGKIGLPLLCAASERVRAKNNDFPIKVEVTSFSFVSIMINFWLESLLFFLAEVWKFCSDLKRNYNTPAPALKWTYNIAYKSSLSTKLCGLLTTHSLRALSL